METSTAELRVVVVDPPFDARDGVLIGPQRGRIVVDPVSASDTATFDFEVTIRRTGDDIDAAGPFVHGKQGDRFVYISWGRPDGSDPFVMFARSKIKFEDLPIALLEDALDSGARLVCEMNGTNARNQPATGTIRPSELSWHLA